MRISRNDILAHFAYWYRGRWVPLCLLAALITATTGGAAQAADTPATQPAETLATQPAATSQPAETQTTQPAESPQPAAAESVAGITAEPPAVAAATGPIRMSFQDAPLRTVLSYLSETAGLIIIEPATVDGRVTVTSRQPLSTEEAVALLDTALRQNGYASIHVGRTLKIVSLEDAGTSNIPVQVGNDPEALEPIDRVITQIIPIQYIKATNLRQDLGSLFPESAVVAANEGSNSLIVTDSQANIRRIIQIVRALDQHLATVSEVRVFQLTYADATSTARLITEVFQAEEAGGASQRGGGFASRMQRMMRGRFGSGRGGSGGDEQQANEGAVTQHVVASADERTNSVVVSAPPELIDVIAGVVRDLDSNPVAEQTVFLHYLENADAESVAEVINNIFSENAQTGRTTTGGRTRQSSRFTRGGTRTSAPQQAAAGAGDLVGDVYVVADADTNSLLVRTSARGKQIVLDILKELDRPVRQVLIKVLIAEVAHDDLLDVGGQFSALNLRLGATGEFTADFKTAGQTGGFLSSTLDSGLSATFEALRKTGKLDILSRPYILASDNQEASIIVGEEVPYITNTRVTDLGQTINTIEYDDVGIILTVTPHVNPRGLVIMDVAPEISSITSATVPISETVDATVFSKRSASTRIAVPNGQTIVIGGLMEDSVETFVRKVPLLGDIPLLGALFRREVEDKVKTELLIFLTPHVAEQPAELAKIAEQEAAAAEKIRTAVEEGAFDKHMKGMKRGAMDDTTGERHASSQ